MEGYTFLKDKFQLQKNAEVQKAVKRTKIRTGEKVGQSAESQIENYLRRFSEIVDRKNNRERGLQALKEVLHKNFVIQEVPESYLEFRRRVLREAGRTEEFANGFPPEAIAGYLETIQEDQKASLDIWIDELSQTGNEFPAWAKYWAIRSILKMGLYDKENHEFSKRTKSTAAPFPELNQEALAVSIDYLIQHLMGVELTNPVEAPVNENIEEYNEDKLVSDEDFSRIIQSQDFSKYYAFALEHVAGDNSELFKIIDGEWRVFPQGSDPAPLVKSLQGHGTGWCTAGMYTASSQLRSGDFHVFYSLNNLGEPKIPRLAILMRGDEIEEVRGVADRQEIDSYISPVLDEKLVTFGEKAKNWQKRSADMKHLTVMTEKRQRGEDFTVEDLQFIWEIDHKIEGFGYERDSRIDELRANRSKSDDLLKIFPNYESATDTESWTADTELLIGDVTVTDNTRLPDALKYIDGELIVQSGTNEIAIQLLETNQIDFYFKSLRKFSGLTIEFAKKILEIGRSESPIIKNLNSFVPAHRFEAVELFLSASLYSKRGTLIDVMDVMNQFTSSQKDKIFQLAFESGNGDLIVSALARLFPDSPNPHRQPSEIFPFLRTRFPGVSNQQLLEAIFQSGDVGSVQKLLVNELQNYNVTDYGKLAQSLWYSNKILLIKHLKNFPGIDQQAYFDKLCPKTDTDDLDGLYGYKLVIENLDCFTDIDPQMMVDRLLSVSGTATLLAKNIANYKTHFDHNSVAQNLIKGDDIGVLVENLSYFKNLSQVTAEALYKMGSHDLVFKYLKSFTGLDAEIVKEALEAEPGYLYDILKSPTSFSNLNLGEIIDYAMQSGPHFIYYVLKNVKSVEEIKGIDGVTLVQQALERNAFEAVVNTLYKFKDLPQSIADSLIEHNHIEDVVRNLDVFVSVNSETVLTYLQDKGEFKKIVEHLEKFPTADQVFLAKKLIENGEAYILAQNADKFDQVESVVIVEMLESAGLQEIVAQNVHTLTGVDHTDALEYLLNLKEIDYIITNRKKYSGVSSDWLVRRLIDVGESWKIANNIKEFEGVNHDEVATRLISLGHINAVASNIDKFDRLSVDIQKSVIEKLLSDKRGKWIAQNINKFTKLTEDEKTEIVKRCR